MMVPSHEACGILPSLQASRFTAEPESLWFCPFEKYQVLSCHFNIALLVL